tara:strand:- start:19941 stop:20207 length:267 start_codon:yes stop_codon:yes gene_type:complete
MSSFYDNRKRTDESDRRTEQIRKEVDKLLRDRFQYTTQTERNHYVFGEISSDMWSIFNLLMESTLLSDKDKIRIKNIVNKEVRRRIKF